MANRYWVGGSAAWDGTAGTKWATTSGGAGGASVPTSADDVFFDAASGAVTVTISAGNTGAKSITCTGFTGTFAGTAGISVAGSITLSSTMGTINSYSGTITITATGTLTTNGKLIYGNLEINAPGGTVTLGSALSIYYLNWITIIAGTFNTSASNYSVSTRFLDARGSQTKTINLNGSTITVTGGSYTTSGYSYYSVIFGANTTLNAGTSTINITGGSSYIDVTGSGSVAFYNVTITATGTSRIDIRGSCSFNNLTFPTVFGPGRRYVCFSSGSTYTINTFVASGANAINRYYFFASTLGSPANLSVTTWTTISDIDFEDISLNSNRSGTRLGDCGGNTNITFPAAKNVYWSLTLNANKTWYDTAWALTSGGTPDVNNQPLPQDTAIFDNAIPSTTNYIVGAFNWAVGNIDFSARTLGLGIGIDGIQVYGNWKSGSGITIINAGGLPIYFVGNKNGTITSAGKSFGTMLDIYKTNASVTLQDALTCTYETGSGYPPLVLTSGTFDAATYNVTLSTTSYGFYSMNTSAIRTLKMGSGTWTITASGPSGISDHFGWKTSSTNLTVTGTATINMTGTDLKRFYGGGVNFGSVTLNQGYVGNLAIYGSNSFGNITNTYGGSSTIIFESGTTTTVSNFTASGRPGSPLSITSSTAGTRATLSKASGAVNVTWLDIKDSAATGGATWTATNSKDNGNNTGWKILGRGLGNFFVFF